MIEVQISYIKSFFAALKAGYKQEKPSVTKAFVYAGLVNLHL